MNTKKLLIICIAVSTISQSYSFAIPPKVSDIELLKELVDNSQLAKEAGVTQEQIKEAKTILRNNRKALAKLNADLEISEVDFEALMENDNPEMSTVMKMIDKAGALEIAIRKERYKTMLMIREIINLEAQKMVKEAILQKKPKTISRIFPDLKLPSPKELSEKFNRKKTGKKSE